MSCAFISAAVISSRYPCRDNRGKSAMAQGSVPVRRWYVSHQLRLRETFPVIAAFRVLVDTFSDRIVGSPAWMSDSHVAMYSGRPIGVDTTLGGVRRVRFWGWGGNVLTRTPEVERARRRRARSVDWWRDGMEVIVSLIGRVCWRSAGEEGAVKAVERRERTVAGRVNLMLISVIVVPGCRECPVCSQVCSLGRLLLLAGGQRSSDPKVDRQPSLCRLVVYELSSSFRRRATYGCGFGDTCAPTYCFLHHRKDSRA
jgi:hypothetical protein